MSPCVKTFRWIQYQFDIFVFHSQCFQYRVCPAYSCTGRQGIFTLFSSPRFPSKMRVFLETIRSFTFSPFVIDNRRLGCSVEIDLQIC